MSLLEQKWKRRTTETYTAADATTRWQDAVSKPPGKVSQPKTARPKKIARRTQINTR